MNRGLTRLHLHTLPRERWANGLGWTRPVAQAADAHQGLLWRVSLAEITEAAPFSCFEGMDRTAVLVHGGPVVLQGPDQRWCLNQPGDEARFAGEWALSNARPEHEAMLWNVMVRRGAAQAQVRCVADQDWTAPGEGIGLVWVLAGCFELAGAGQAPLRVGDGLWLPPGEVGVVLRPASSDARLLVTTVQPQA
ncbi:HutD family protein [Aquabacterium sp. A3]|uniref:HutD/Ves family protein n=1 Tax=Aquabacterium sp. A3 TaxID=3132829 RepID=UPI00311969B0